jgi:DNA invertase Pin-like site-specific DNA recombinase
MAQRMLSVMGAFAECARAFPQQRPREGMALAKQRGAQRERKQALAPDYVAALRARAEAGAKQAPRPRVRHQS